MSSSSSGSGGDIDAFIDDDGDDVSFDVSTNLSDVTLNLSDVSLQQQQAPPPPPPKTPEDEIVLLQEKLEQIQEQLNAQLRLNTVLAQSKEQLGTEVDELTQTLFEEANNLVKGEAEEKSKLRKRNIILEKELVELRSLLVEEREELKNLKTFLILNDPSTSAKLPPLPNHTLIPRKLDSKTLLKGPFSKEWNAIHSSLDSASLRQFSLFIDRIIRGELGRVFQKIREVKDKNLEKYILTRLVNDPYFKDIWNGELLPILSFPYNRKPAHLSIGKLCRAMFHSDGIVLLNDADADFDTGDDNNDGNNNDNANNDNNNKNGDPLTSEEDEEDEKFSKISASDFKRERGTAMMSSVTSLPDIVIGFFKPLPPKSSPSPPPKTFKTENRCMLCGSANNAKTFEISANQVRLDAVCEDKLAAVQALFRWIMRLQESVFLTRPLIDMYYELLEIRRAIFYCGRLPPGSKQYFLQADLEDSWNSLVNS